MVVGSCYPWQSIYAFLTTIPLCAYIPIVFFVIYFIGIVLPLLPIVWLLKDGSRSFVRLASSFVLTPVLFLVSAFLFYLILPYAAISVHWLRADDVIKASNGPSFYFYRYVTSFGHPLRLPAYYSITQQTYRDLVRTHVASIYLSDSQHYAFVKNAYPAVFSEMEKSKGDRAYQMKGPQLEKIRQWKEKYPEFINHVKTANGGKMSFDYLSSRLNRVKGRIVYNEKEGLILLFKMPHGAVYQQSEDGKKEYAKSKNYMVFKDEDLDGMPDYFKTIDMLKPKNPNDKPHKEDSGYTAMKDAENQSSLIYLWGVVMGQAINQTIR
jgi:hypothetical protein